MIDFVEAWVGIIKDDQKHKRETGWSYFDEIKEANDGQERNMGRVDKQRNSN